MRRIAIDLALKVLPKDHPVYMVRPGSGYQLYHQVMSSEAIAPDFPYLNVPDGTPPSEAAEFDAQISRAVAVRQWLKQPLDDRGPRPSRKLDNYRLGHSDNTATRTRLRNAAQEILWNLPDGALVFIPSATLAGTGLTADLGKRTEPRITMEGDGNRNAIKYLGRPIHAMKRQSMRALPEDVTDPVRLPMVTFQYEGYARDRLLRAHYGDYQLGTDVAMMEFISNSDKFGAISMARLTALAHAIEYFVVTGKYQAPGNLLYKPAAVALETQVHASINSKYGRLLIEGPQMVPHIMRALVLVCMLANTSVSADDLSGMMVNGQLELSNSKATRKDVKVTEATERTLLDFAAAAGHPSLTILLKGLLESSESTEGEVDGTAKLK